MTPSDRYKRMIDNVHEAALRCGRNPQDITLIAVSKKQSLASMLSVYEAGCRDFGESRVQEALEKALHLPKNMRVHLIGTLQKNKVTKAVGSFSLIHSVDTVELAQKISSVSQEMGCITPVLIQVNTSGEISKHGLSKELWEAHLESLIQLPGIKIEGLMTMAPLTTDQVRIHEAFSFLRRVQEGWRARLETLVLPHLSMGMSHDFEAAIAEGATLLRIGSAIFA